MTKGLTFAKSNTGHLFSFFWMRIPIAQIIPFWSLFLQNMKAKDEVDDNEKRENIPYRICCITSD